MGDSVRLGSALTSYLNFQSRPGQPPTFEGLALAAGFSSFAQLRQAILNDKHPQASVDMLIIACAHIADHYQQNGLLETLNPAFIKYLLSAYLNISEKSISESNITDNKTITITWASSPDENHLPTPEERTRIAATSTSTKALEDELRELEYEELL